MVSKIKVGEIRCVRTVKIGVNYRLYLSHNGLAVNLVPAISKALGTRIVA